MSVGRRAAADCLLWLNSMMLEKVWDFYGKLVELTGTYFRWIPGRGDFAKV